MLLPLGAFWRLSRWRAQNPSRREQRIVDKVRERVPGLLGATDQSLREQVAALRERARRGHDMTSDEELPAALALVHEAARRALGVQLYDVQLRAGIVLTRGGIAEMQTGEGKTFVAALPAFVRALRGSSVHVMTVNAYLAERDHETLAPVFQLLGLSTGLLRTQAARAAKRAVYEQDIIYGPGYEFGFDYLRDQLARCTGQQPLGQTLQRRLEGRTSAEPSVVQRERAFAVIDEADSVMIDEATTPLLLSQTGSLSPARSSVYQLAKETAESLQTHVDYVLDENQRSVMLTGHGMRRLAEVGAHASRLGLDRPWVRYVELALHAEHFLRLDIDYTLVDGQVQIVDQQTGRIFAERSWRAGLHQAVQAKERVCVSAEQKPLARITRQRFFMLYEGLCGMTGTTIGSEHEFRRVYRMSVTRIPTHRPNRRIEYPTRYFASAEPRWKAVVDEAREMHRRGRPVLIGTSTIEESERLAAEFQQAGLDARLLNGKQDADEADIVAQAGGRGAITIATNMAGRGTDIKLGPGVAELGGLHVIACQRHESRRVDRQLAGRAARQGDPGSVRFYVAAEDPLVVHYGRGLAGRLVRGSDVHGEYPGDLGPAVVAAQRRAETVRLRERQNLFRHDDWIDQLNARLLDQAIV